MNRIQSREFNHRIKGVGHSAFTNEEADFLSKHGNDVVNAKYLANYNASGERLRPPDGTNGTVDGQLLRVWFRRKYVDQAWLPAGSRGGIGMAQNAQAQNIQPTKAHIPPKRQAAAPAADLLGGWDSAPAAVAVTVAPTPPARPPRNSNANTDAAWDAFGQSRTAEPAFQAKFNNPHNGNMGNGNQQQPSFQANFNDPHNGNMGNGNQQQPSFQANFNDPHNGNMGNGNQQPQPAFQTDFGQMHKSPDPPQQQQTQSSFNPNFPQPSTPTRRSHAQAGFNAGFPENPSASQQDQIHQQMSGAKFQQQLANPQFPAQAQAHNFQNAYPEPQLSMQVQQGNLHPQVAPPAPNSTQLPHQEQNAFNANFQQTQPPPFQMPAPNSPQAPQQQETAFNANFQQQQPPPQPPLHSPQMSQQNTVNANFQQQQSMPIPIPNSSHMPSQQPNTFNANFGTLNEQQTLPVPAPVQAPQPQNGFHANFQQQPQQPPPPASVQESQPQSTFTANVQQQQQSQPQPQEPPPPAPVQASQPQSTFTANFQQPQLPAPVPESQQQNSFNANLQQQQQHHDPTLPQVSQQQNAGNANFGSLNRQQPLPVSVPSQASQQNGFNANFQQQQQQQQQQSVPNSVTNVPQTLPVIPSQNPQQENSAHLGVSEHVPTGATSAAMPSSSMGVGSNSSDPFDAFDSLTMNAPLSEPNSTVTATGVPKANTQAVETETNTANQVQKYEVGQILEYRDSQQNVSMCEIIRDHLDDDLIPFYDVRMSDGREKQTDNHHLRIPSGPTSADVVSSTVNDNIVSKEASMNKITAMLGSLNGDQLIQLQKYMEDNF